MQRLLSKMGAVLAGTILLAGPPVRFGMPEESGIDFVLQNGATGNRHQIETMTGGVAVLDFDQDGLLDLFFVNGARSPSLDKSGAEFRNRLYRNEGGWRFTDVTDTAGVGGTGYGMGVAAGDYNNDGFPDLYVTGVRGNTLYRNNRDGTFRDVTSFTGTAGLQIEGESQWAVAAAWLDYDNDGHQDLFVVNYVAWDPAREPFCGDSEKQYRTYCHPKYYPGLPNVLYRNRGDGTFTDVSSQVRISELRGKGMGVAIADYDGDGWMDIFVANDAVPDFLFRNEGGRQFREVAAEAGVAFNDDGRALSSMGVDFRDVDGDGKPDLFVTALANETFPLFRNIGGGFFEDVTYRTGIGRHTMRSSGWGTGAYDWNNDGHRDLFAAAGDVQDNTEVYSSGLSKQPNFVLMNGGAGGFERIETPGGPALHRGAAFGDLDNDGRIDIVVSRLNAAPLLLRNESEAANWVGFALQGRGNRSVIGAEVRVTDSSGRRQWNHLTTSVGYASSSDPRVHFGLGQSEPVEVEIRWPGGRVQKLDQVKLRRYIAVEEPD